MKRAFPLHPRSAVSVLLRKGNHHLDSYALIKRGNPPRQGEWAMPGGAVELGVTQLEQAYLEVEEELGISRDCLLWNREPLGCRDVIIKDDNNQKIQYHYTISHFFAQLIGNDTVLVAGDDASEAVWWTSKADKDTNATNAADQNNDDLVLVKGSNKIIKRLEHIVHSNSNTGVIKLQSPDLPTPPTDTMIEVKKKMNGKKQEFELERWHWNTSTTTSTIVGRWVAPKGGAYGMEEGSYSWGVWGKGVFDEIGLGVYRMHSKDGTLKGYRFDVLEGLDGIVHCEHGSDGGSGNGNGNGNGNGSGSGSEIDEKKHVMTFNDLLLDGIIKCNQGSSHELNLIIEDEEEVTDWKNQLNDKQIFLIDQARNIFKDEKQLRDLVGKVNDVIGRVVSERRVALG